MNTLKSKKIILVDFDDVIDTLFPVWVEYLNKTYNLTVDYKMLRGWNMRNHFPMLTTDQIYSCLHTEDFWSNVYLKWEAIYYLKKLYSEGYDIYIVTSSSYITMEIKWKKFFDPNENSGHKILIPNFLHDKVITTNNKHLIKGDILIDDGLHNLVGGDYKKILFTSFSNLDCDYLLPVLGIHRAKDWKECYKLIHELVPLDS